MITKPIIPIPIMLVICIIIILIKRKNKTAFLRQIAISLLIFVINLRIMLPFGESTEVSNNLDVLFVVDNTISMLAEDYNGKKLRFDGVKESCKYITEELASSRFSVISFDDKSNINIPFTTDASIVLDTLSSIQQYSELYAKGSSLNSPQKDMESVLKRSLEKDGRERIVFFLSDGEITNGDKLKSYSGLSKYISNGAVLGYGTDDGGNMKVKEYNSENEVYLDDKSSYPYTKAVSKIDESNLKKIAKDLKIDYIHVKNNSSLEKKISEIKNDGVNNTKSYIDIYYLFVIPLIILLIYELIYFRRRL